MSAMTNFTFRQRVGKLNWKLVSSIELEDVIMGLKVFELQSVLDSITFCEFDSREIKNNSVESIRKLVQIQQLITEYLLYCQESNYISTEKLKEKFEKCKTSYKKLKKENISLIEDTKIYQRQLATLRQALYKNQNLLEGRGGNEEKIPPRPYDLYGRDRTREDDKIRDRETNELIARLLAEQRQSFAEQLNMVLNSKDGPSSENSAPFSGSTRENNNTSNSNGADALRKSFPDADKWLNSLNKQIENIVKSAVQSNLSQQQQQPAAVQRRSYNLDDDDSDQRQQRSQAKATTAPPKRQEVDVMGILRESALENAEEELNVREKALERKEKALVLREKALKMASEDNSRAIELAQKENYVVLYDSWKRKSRAFSVFRNNFHQNRRLKEQTAAVKKSMTRGEMLEQEKEYSRGVLDKCDALTRELEFTRQQLRDSNDKIKAMEEKEKDLSKLIAESKGRAAVDQARHNIAIRKIEEEKIALSKKVADLEKQQRQQPVVQKGEFATSAVGTTLDLAIMVPSQPSQSAVAIPPAKKSKILDNVSAATRRLFLAASEGTDDNDLLSEAERRVLYRKNPQSIASAVVRTLATEIQTKLHHEDDDGEEEEEEE